MVCKICHHSESIDYKVREMMTGTRDVFHYSECKKCGCVQLADDEIEAARYYGFGYYSLSRPFLVYFKPAIKAWLKKYRDLYALTGRGALGRLINSWMPSLNIELYNLRKAGFTPDNKILDVGCGSGWLTYMFYNAGFKGITGIDPHLKEDITYNNKLVIKKMSLEEVQQTGWDALLFHHSLEHMPDPFTTLEQVHRLLKTGGKCIIRLPTASSYAWHHYREHWVQLDAPRHYFLYTIEALKILAEKTGFSFTYLADESTAFQFTGSEQYKMGIPLRGDKRSWFEGNQELFTREQIAAFAERAKDLNKQRQGDSISVLFQKI